MLAYITWTVDPAIFTIGDREIRWYGLFFALGFFVGYKILEKMFKHEDVRPEWLEKLFIYIIAGTVIGARLGHCVFYNFTYYFSHPVEILKIWEGGLSSHGGAIGIICAVWLFSRYTTKRSMLWTFDRLVVPVALVGAMIRTGNLMNHEIYGHPTDAPWAFKFVMNVTHHFRKNAEAIFSQPSHPTQIYEASAYLLVFALLMYLYWKTNAKDRQGLIFGVFLIGIFTARFFIEFIKENQEAFEDGMFFNMGQLLSIPFILAGIYFVYKSMKNQPVTYAPFKDNKSKKQKNK